MKLTIRRYCNEGHDILSAKDMRKALLEHPVSGATASVNKVDVSKMSADIKPMKDFNSFHNFEIEEQGLGVRKAYGIGKGKFIPFSDIVVKKQEQTDIEEDDGFLCLLFYSRHICRRASSIWAYVVCMFVCIRGF